MTAVRPGVTLRPASADDAPEIAVIWHLGWRDGHLGFVSEVAVVAGNARARRFYERRGWADAGPFAYAAAGVDGPIQVPVRRYVKRVS